MKAGKVGLVAAEFICFLILLPNTASARVHFRIAFGTSTVHDYSGFYIGCHPHYRWHRGYYRWLDRDRYRWLDQDRYRWLDRDRYRWLDRGRYRGPYVLGRRHFCRRRPLYSSGVSIWIRDYYPMVADCPIAVETPKVITKRQVVAKTREYDEETTRLFGQLRRKRSKLLEKLKSANKQGRKEAIDKLAGFSYDDKVRVALEDILLSDSDPELRAEVAKSLAGVKNKKVLPALQKAKAEDSNQEVRQQANKAIKKIKG